MGTAGICNRSAVSAVAHLHMAIAGLGGHILGIYQHSFHTVEAMLMGSDIHVAGRSGQFSAILTHLRGHEISGIIQAL